MYPSFSIHYLVPAPFRVAIQVVALAEGWPHEALLLAIVSNVGWLEHPETRLKVRARDVHSRTPNFPIFIGGDPSIRKSSLKQYTSRTLLQSASTLRPISEMEPRRVGTARCEATALRS